MRKRIVIMTLVLSLLLLAGCASPFVENEPKTVLEAETVMVKALGLELVVTDKSTGTEYRFKPKLVRRSEAAVEPVEVIVTPTMRVETIRGGLRITSGNKVYIIHTKHGGVWK